MKPNTLAFLCLLFLGACAHTEFREWDDGGQIYKGRGGSKRVVEGIEIWDHNGPPRKYKPIGTIMDTRRNNIFTDSSLDALIVKSVKEKGADAAILMTSSTQFAGLTPTTAYTSGSVSGRNYSGYTTMSGGDAIYDRSTGIVLIRYVK